MLNVFRDDDIPISLEKDNYIIEKNKTGVNILDVTG